MTLSFLKKHPDGIGAFRLSFSWRLCDKVVGLIVIATVKGLFARAG
jgi:hypothetical protein